MIDNLSTVLPEKLRRGGLLSGSLCLQLSHRRVLESRPGHAPVPETRESPTVLTCFRGLHVVTQILMTQSLKDLMHYGFTH